MLRWLLELARLCVEEEWTYALEALAPIMTTIMVLEVKVICAVMMLGAYTPEARSAAPKTAPDASSASARFGASRPLSIVEVAIPQMAAVVAEGDATSITRPQGIVGLQGGQRGMQATHTQGELCVDCVMTDSVIT